MVLWRALECVLRRVYHTEKLEFGVVFVGAILENIYLRHFLSLLPGEFVFLSFSFLQYLFIYSFV